MAYDLASFKNSREYSRKATTDSQTYEGIVAASGGPLTVLRPRDLNRTYLTLRNLADPAVSPLDVIRYYYVDDGAADPLIAVVLAQGFVLKPGEAIDLESPEKVVAISETLNPIPYNIDEGTG